MNFTRAEAQENSFLFNDSNNLWDYGSESLVSGPSNGPETLNKRAANFTSYTLHRTPLNTNFNRSSASMNETRVTELNLDSINFETGNSDNFEDPLLEHCTETLEKGHSSTNMKKASLTNQTNLVPLSTPFQNNKSTIGFSAGTVSRQKLQDLEEVKLRYLLKSLEPLAKKERYQHKLQEQRLSRKRIKLKNALIDTSRKEIQHETFKEAKKCFYFHYDDDISKIDVPNPYSFLLEEIKKYLSTRKTEQYQFDHQKPYRQEAKRYLLSNISPKNSRKQCDARIKTDMKVRKEIEQLDTRDNTLEGTKVVENFSRPWVKPEWVAVDEKIVEKRQQFVAERYNLEIAYDVMNTKCFVHGSTLNYRNDTTQESDIADTQKMAAKKMIQNNHHPKAKKSNQLSVEFKTIKYELGEFHSARGELMIEAFLKAHPNSEIIKLSELRAFLTQETSRIWEDWEISVCFADPKPIPPEKILESKRDSILARMAEEESKKLDLISEVRNKTKSLISYKYINNVEKMLDDQDEFFSPTRATDPTSPYPPRPDGIRVRRPRGFMAPPPGMSDHIHLVGFGNFCGFTKNFDIPSYELPSLSKKHTSREKYLKQKGKLTKHLALDLEKVGTLGKSLSKKLRTVSNDYGNSEKLAEDIIEILIEKAKQRQLDRTFETMRMIREQKPEMDQRNLNSKESRLKLGMKDLRQRKGNVNLNTFLKLQLSGRTNKEDTQELQPAEDHKPLKVIGGNFSKLNRYLKFGKSGEEKALSQTKYPGGKYPGLFHRNDKNSEETSNFKALCNSVSRSLSLRGQEIQGFRKVLFSDDESIENKLESNGEFLSDYVIPEPELKYRSDHEGTSIEELISNPDFETPAAGAHRSMASDDVNEFPRDYELGGSMEIRDNTSFEVFFESGDKIESTELSKEDNLPKKPELFNSVKQDINSPLESSVRSPSSIVSPIFSGQSLFSETSPITVEREDWAKGKPYEYQDNGKKSVSRPAYSFGYRRRKSFVESG